MINLTQVTPSRGDCTAGYAVSMTKEYSVREFIAEVLTLNEWGDIGIYKENQAWFESGDPYCTYKRDKLITTMSDEVLDKKVIKATASGGWSNMNYILHI